jgi:tRNA threonylcarbamoyladenosine biosynthesis protein TsaB
MTTLAFDTCFGACSVAVQSEGGSVVAQRFEAMDKGHSERIMPMIAEVLTEAGLAIADVGCVAVTVGPGSFTGVRTGLAVARSLALALKCEVRGTTSLHVMAAGLRADDPHLVELPLAIAVATRDGLVYFEAFAGVAPASSGPPRLLRPSSAATLIAHTPYAVAGSGAAWVVTAGAAAGMSHRLSTSEVPVRADILLGMAKHLPPLTPPRPLYLREADAKPGAASILSFAETRI